MKLFRSTALVILLLAGCTPHDMKHSTPAANTQFDDKYAGQPLPRKGDEIMAAGQLFHTGTRVILWTDPGGYDAYRTERRFSPWDQSGYERSKLENKEIAGNGPSRYSVRRRQIDSETFDRIRGGGWDLPTLQSCIDQFVIHYDCCGTSQLCFRVLQDDRALSVHFMLDLDGTIYQTLDLKERAWHATRSNDRSIGIEIASIGAYENLALLKEWYTRDPDGQLRITLPHRFGDGGLKIPGIYRPARNQLITGEIQHTQFHQYDFTPQQYAALIRLTATLCTVFPRITIDAPREPDGRVINHVLTDTQWASYQGVLGHYHVDANKEDPGPAFDWEKVLSSARALMSPEARSANQHMRGHPAKPVNP
jgi:N-acetyl-anhydromuramyl-L-alanine amidase AmpD